MRIRARLAPLAFGLFLFAGAGAVRAQTEATASAGTPMNWRRDQLWQIFWAPRWLEGLTLPPHLTLNETRSGVQERVTYDPGLEMIVAHRSQRDVEVVPPRLFTPREYAEELTRIGFNNTWREETARTLGQSTADNQKAQGGLVNIDLPFQLPKGLSSIFGEGAPNLRVSGSEQITIGGTSTWRVPELNREGRQRSKFPTLEMRQQLNVRLNGTIGDKLHIDISQNSEASTSLENQMRIYYQGYEDDVVQRVDLGNTNLSLPRTQYISLSARQEGLFGFKMQGRLADWDFTAIASKQEGQSDVASFTGGSRETQIGGEDARIYDYEFEKRKYFFLFDPDTSSFLYDPDFAQIRGEDLAVFINTNNPTSDYQQGREVIENPRITITGSEPVAPDTAVFREQVYRLTPNEDYYFVTSERTAYPFIVMRSGLSPEWVMSVSYRITDRDGNVVGQVGNFFDPNRPEGDPVYLKMIYAPNREKESDFLQRGPWAPTRRLEMKNIYYLGVRNIDPETFYLQIRRDSGNQPSFVDSVASDPGRPGPISYLELLGLDLQNNDTQLAREDPGDGAKGPDGRVDPRWVDYENGLLFFPDLRPFDPSSIDLNGALLATGDQDGNRAPSRERPRSRALGYRTLRNDPREPRFGVYYERLPLTEGDAEVNDEIYDRRDQQEEFRKYYLTGTFKAFQTEINLNRIGILENSETVRMNGEVLNRGTDYSIEYGTGQVRLLSNRAIDPNGQLQITYSYTPLFARGDRSLAGFSTMYGGSPNWDLSSTVLYETKGSPDRRPRLEQEPSRTILGDLSGSWRARPWLLTEIADALPLVTTNAPSNISLAGALGVSVPNPNTRGDVFLDDMEGVVQTQSAQILREAWQYSSRPAVEQLFPDPEGTLRDEDRLGGLWFSVQREVQAKDLAPRLETVEGNDYVSVMGIIMMPNRSAVRPWLALVQPLSETGVDLSEAQYIELWINDFNRFHGDNAEAGEGKEIRIDLGKVSEDAVWDPRNPPLPANGTLDNEDRNNDGQRTLEEDAGLDGVPDAVEISTGVPPDTSEYPVSTPSDPMGDNYSFQGDGEDYTGTIADRIERFRHLNGTENNDRLDSENLNSNLLIDTDQSYFEYTIPFNDTAFTVIDVQGDYGLTDPDNGWRLLRVPLNHPTRRKVGEPDLNTIRHIRIWFAGFEDTAEVQIATLDIVGNRWERQPIRGANGVALPDSDLYVPGIEKIFNVAVVNNKENDDYYSPFGPREVNNVIEREQSLSLEFENLDPGEQVSAFRPLNKDEDYTLYQTLSYFAQPRLDSPADSLEFFVRLSSAANNDTTNVYEIATRQLTASTWRSIDLVMEELSALKIDAPDSALNDPDRLSAEKMIGDLRVRVYGKPSFSQIRRLQVGLRNVGPQRISQGQLWFNELRLGAVRRDTGLASRASLGMSLGDFASFSAAFTQTNADFLTLGQSRGRGITTRDFNFGTSVNVDRMLTGTNLALPFRFDIRRNRNIPKFRTNDDIIFSGTGVDITETGATALGAQIRRASDQYTPWFIRATIDAMAFSFNYNKNFSNQTSQVDSGMVASGSASYAFRIADPPGLPLPGRWKFTPLPNTFTATYTGGYTEQVSYGRDQYDPGRLTQLSRKANRTSALQSLVSFRPLPPLTYNVTSQRDMVDQNFALVGLYRPSRKIAGIDFGREIGRTERLTFTQSISLTQFFRPRISWSGDYNEDHRPQIVTPTDVDTPLTVIPDLKNIENRSSTTIGMTFPMSRVFTFLAGAGGRPGRRTQTPPQQPPQTAPTRPAPGQPDPASPDGSAPPPPTIPAPPPPNPAQRDSMGNVIPTDTSQVIQVPSDPLPSAPSGGGAGASSASPGALEPLPGAVPDTSGTTPPPRIPQRGRGQRQRSGIGGRTTTQAPPDTSAPRTPEEELQRRAREEEAAREAAADKAQDDAAKQPPRQQSGGGGGPGLFTFLFRDLFSIGDIRTNFTTSRRNAVTRVNGSPPLAFRLGLSDEFGDVIYADNSNESRTKTNSATGNGTITVLRDFSVDTNFQWNDSETNNNRAISKVRTMVWPGFRMNLNNLEKKLRLSGIFATFSASSNYERREEVAGTGSNARERVTVGNAWRPFFQFEASLRNGWRTSFSTDRTSTHTESNATGLSTTGVATDRENQAYRLSLSKSLGVSRNRAGSRGSVDVSMDVTYSKDSSVTVYPGRSDNIATRNDNFQGRVSTSYRFTQTVSGTVQLSVGQRRDLETEIAERSIGLNATAGINF